MLGARKRSSMDGGKAIVARAATFAGLVALLLLPSVARGAPPNAADDTGGGYEDSGPFVVHVLENDSDPDGDPFFVGAYFQPSHGASFCDNTLCTYRPNPNFSGTDSFNYIVSDGNGGFDGAQVTITVFALADPPDAVDDSATVPGASGPNPIDVLGNDVDVDGDALAISAVTQGAHGEVVITGGGDGLTYEPVQGYSGSDSFRYTVSDGSFTDTATVTVTVPPPVISAADASVREGDAGIVVTSVAVSLDRVSAGPVIVYWRTANRSAVGPGDYLPSGGTLTIPAGTTGASIPISIVGDVMREPDETFAVEVYQAAGATIGDGEALVTIVNDDDTTPPVIATKKDVIAESKVAPVAVLYASPTASDNRDGSVPVSCEPASGSKFPLGTTGVKCTATDRNGNVATGGFNVIVRLPTTSGAVTDPKDLTLPLTGVEPEQRVRVNAGGFAPRSKLRLLFVTATGEQIELETPKAGKDGRFDVRVDIPEDVPPGQSQMTAVGVDVAGSELVRAWLLTVVPEDEDD